MKRSRRCSACGRTVAPDSPSHPFCCERCRLLDLDNWLEGRYRIPGEPIARGDVEESAGGEGEPAGD